MQEYISDFLLINGDTKIRFRNPNSLSKMIGKPELIALLNAVNIIIPGFKNSLYFMAKLSAPNKFIGAFWKSAPNNISHSKGWIKLIKALEGLLYVCKYSL